METSNKKQIRFQKILNDALKKKYRYQKLGFKDNELLCNIIISLYSYDYDAYLEYMDKLNLKTKNYYATFAYLVNEIKNNKIKKLKEKNLFDLTDKEAKDIGGNTYKEYCKIKNKLLKYVCLLYKDDSLCYETLDDLAKILRSSL